MADFDSSSVDAAFSRGQMLQSQRRIQDAISCYQQALGMDPNHVPSYMMLALCWLENEDTRQQALDAAQRAVALEPEQAFARSVLALAMNGCAKDGQTAALRQTLKEAETAVGLDPGSDFSHAVVARLHLRLRNYPEAEAAAREALALDLENTMAAEILSAALLMQRKDADNQDLIDYQLQRNAEDDSAHTSAGWMALMQGDHKKANQHFLEALRLDAMNEGARMGLIESYRARSWPYRMQLKFAHFMNQFTEGRQTMIMLGGFFCYKVLSNSLKSVSPLLASVVVGVWLLFALWSHLARGFSSFFVVLDRYARQALSRRELWEGLVVGGLIFAALANYLILYAMGAPNLGSHLALVCILAAVASASALTNDHWLGRYLYGAAGIVSVGGALYLMAAVVAQVHLPYASELSLVALSVGVVVTWLRALRVLYH